MELRWFTGSAGRIDARLHGPPGGPPVMVLHPHPLFGGTMGSRLVYDLAQALAAAGFRAVRFDYRGVGRSEGRYGEGLGELQDALAIFDALAAGSGTVPIVIGYSFGAAVACRLATERKPARLVLVACPAALPESPLDAFVDAADVHVPTHVIVGSRDPFISPDEARVLAEMFHPPAQLVVLDGAEHFVEPSRNGDAVAAVLAALRE